jgi:hypothetical protein
MRTIHGILDKHSYRGLNSGGVESVTFEGQTLIVPDGSSPNDTCWLMFSTSFGLPLSLEVDDGGVIRKVTFEDGAYGVTVTLPAGERWFKVPWKSGEAFQRARVPSCP